MTLFRQAVIDRTYGISGDAVKWYRRPWIEWTGGLLTLLALIGLYLLANGARSVSQIELVGETVATNQGVQARFMVPAHAYRKAAGQRARLTLENNRGMNLGQIEGVVSSGERVDNDMASYQLMITPARDYIEQNSRIVTIRPGMSVTAQITQ